MFVRKLCVGLAATMVAAAVVSARGAEGARTWCNPISLPNLPMGYLCRDNKNGDAFPPGTSWRRRFWELNTAGLKTIQQFREVADPAILAEGDTWYLYPSCGLMWSTTDCGGTWKHIPVKEKGWYAPGVAKFRGKYYLVETGGQPLKVADAPTGPFRELGKFKWETFGSDKDMPPPQDPALFEDEGRLYLYWGCCSYPKAVWGAELDPDDPTKCKGEAKCLVTWDPKAHDFHDELIEGAWMFRRGEYYYIVYSTYLIVGHHYCMAYAKGKSPLGAFAHPENNPIFKRTNPFYQKPNGLVTGTGHGSVWKDARGDYWVNSCVEVNAYNGCERLVAQDRIDFAPNGDIVPRCASETPQWLPSSGKKGDTGWIALPLETAMLNAVDKSLQTWWTPPEVPTKAEFFLREPTKIESVRVIWRELGLDTLRGVKPGPIRYRVEARVGGAWQTWIDRSASEEDLLVDYREGSEVTADAVRLTVLGAPQGITPAVTEFTVFGLPNDVPPPPAPQVAPPDGKWTVRKGMATVPCEPEPGESGVDWGADAPRMAKLWKQCSDAYSFYPVANMMQYYGPFHDGVVWKLHPDLDFQPLSRSWIRDLALGDTIGECLEGFTLDEACALAKKMCDCLEATDDLDALAAKYATDVRRSRELGVMKAFRLLCRSGRNVLDFYRARRDAVTASRVKLDRAAAHRHVAEMRRLAVEAKRWTAEMIPLCEKDSRLGFHSEAETYKFHPALLKWRLADLDRVIARIAQIEHVLSGFECGIYPDSEWEREAPVVRLKRGADGRVVIEGACATNDERDVEISLYDPTGTEYPAMFTAKNEKGRYRAVAPEGTWGWIRVRRPGIEDLPQPNASVDYRLKIGRTAIRNCARLVVEEPNETAVWQKAIDEKSAAGGGTVTVPAGRHVVGALFLKDNVTLELAAGAVLEGMPGLQNYMPVDVGYAEVREPWYGLVCAVGVTNVAVVGKGEIFGNGAKFLRGHREGRPRGLLFYNCRNVRLEGVFLHDLASWTCYLRGCDGVTVRRVRVDSHANSNNDGIDIDSKNVLVEDCDFDSDDDGIVLKSDNPRVPVENVTVRNCRVRSNCSALKLGTGSHGGFINISFENIKCGVSDRATMDPETGHGEIAQYRVETWPGSTFDPSLLSGIAIESVDGARAENLTFRNIEIAAAATPIFIRGGTRYGRTFGFQKRDLCIPMGEAKTLKNVLIENVTAKATSFTANSITGTDEIRPTDVTLRNVAISVPGAGDAGKVEIGKPVPEKADKYPESNMFDSRMLPAYGFYIRHADNVRFENVKVTVRGSEVRPEIVTDDVTGWVRR